MSIAKIGLYGAERKHPEPNKSSTCAVRMYTHEITVLHMYTHACVCVRVHVCIDIFIYI